MVEELPSKITPDSIVEALVDVHFESSEMLEMAVGRFYTSTQFGRFDKVRLPQADIPQMAREADENLRYQPMYQLQAENELVRFGSNMISHHLLKPYCGWDAFRLKLEDVLRESLQIWGSPRVRRVSLRYINALTSKEHSVGGMRDLNLSVTVNDDVIENVLVNFVTKSGDNFEVIVRASAKDLVNGDLPPDTKAVIDIEVRSTGATAPQDLSSIMNWIDGAHDLEKKQFFALLPAAVIDPLVER